MQSWAAPKPDWLHVTRLHIQPSQCCLEPLFPFPPAIQERSAVQCLSHVLFLCYKSDSSVGESQAVQVIPEMNMGSPPPTVGSQTRSYGSSHSSADGNPSPPSFKGTGCPTP